MTDSAAISPHKRETTSSRKMVGCNKVHSLDYIFTLLIYFSILRHIYMYCLPLHCIDYMFILFFKYMDGKWICIHIALF